MLQDEIAKIIVRSYDGVDETHTGNGTAYFSSGHKYTGDLVNGTLHGKGTYVWKDGFVTYSGDFKENKIEGHGNYVWKDGCQYTGFLESGLRNGLGKFEVPVGLQYDGEWKSGRPNGTGRVDYSATSHYQGGWLDGQRHGFGIMQYETGNTYEGEWSNGVKHGKGKMNWVSRQELYDGDWKDGKPDGHGVYVWSFDALRDHQNPTQNRYEGKWFDGKRHGYGEFQYASGAKYEGEFFMNMKHGKGKYVSENGRYYIGEFKNDKPVETFKPFSNETPFFFKVYSNGSTITKPELLKELNSVILRHIGDLRNLYHAYSKTYITEKYNRRKVLKREDIWKLFKELKLTHKGFTLAELDRAYAKEFYKDPCFGSRYTDPHNPNTEFIFHDFLEYLLLVSYHIYQNAPELSIHEHRLASCFSHLITKDVMVEAKALKPPVPLTILEQFQSMLMKEFEHAYVDKIYGLMAFLTKRSSHALPGAMKDKSLSVRDFLFILKNYGLFEKWESVISITDVINDFGTHLPQVANGGNYNLEHELIHLDVFGAIYDIAKKIATRKFKGKPEKILARAIAMGIDWKDEYAKYDILNDEFRQECKAADEIKPEVKLSLLVPDEKSLSASADSVLPSPVPGTLSPAASSITVPPITPPVPKGKQHGLPVSHSASGSKTPVPQESPVELKVSEPEPEIKIIMDEPREPGRDLTKLIQTVKWNMIKTFEEFLEAHVVYKKFYGILMKSYEREKHKHLAMSAAAAIAGKRPVEESIAIVEAPVIVQDEPVQAEE